MSKVGKIWNGTGLTDVIDLGNLMEEYKVKIKVGDNIFLYIHILSFEDGNLEAGWNDEHSKPEDHDDYKEVKLEDLITLS